MKTCIKCKIEKELTEFSKDKNLKDGLKYQCKSCDKLYKDLNKEKIKEYEKKYSEINKDKINTRRKKYYEDNKEKSKKYYEDNKEKIYQNIKQKRNINPLFKLSGNLRNLIKWSIKSKSYRKKIKTELILGCSFEEFKLHLESQFESWMTWDNYGLYNGELNYGWDVDHTIPIASAKSEEELIKLNHYTNLQPLCSKVNRYIKRDKLDVLYFHEI